MQMRDDMAMTLGNVKQKEANSIEIKEVQSVEFFVVRIRKNSSEKETLQWHRIVRNKSSIGKDSELMNMSI